MAKKSCNCMSEDAKAALEALGDQGLNAALANVPECPDGANLRFCAGRGKGAKREPSDYNKFMGTCMKEGGAPKFQDAGKKMKTCAAKWQERK